MKGAIFASLLVVAWLSVLAAADRPTLRVLSEMRTRYVEEVQSKSAKVREQAFRFRAAGTNDNIESFRLDEFGEAEKRIRKLERDTRPPIANVGTGSSRIWNAVERDGGYSPRGDCEHYRGGPNDDVILCNREFVDKVTDLSLPGRGGIAFVFQRCYYSNSRYDGPLGWGWDSLYNARLIEEGQEGMSLYVNGLQYRFLRAGDQWSSVSGNFFHLVKEGETFFVYSSSRTRMEFERSNESRKGWRLRALASRHGAFGLNRIEVAYRHGCDRIEKVSEPFGHVIQFAYDVNGRIVRIWSDMDDIRYSYDGNGLLVSVASSPVAISLSETKKMMTSYCYDKTTNGYRMISRREANSSRTYCIGYDSHGAVEVIGFVANGLDARWRFSSVSNIVTVVPAQPAPRVKYAYDKKSASPDLPIRRLVPALGGVQSFAYSASGLLVESVDELGVKVEYVYDEKNVLPYARKNVLSLTTYPRVPIGIPSKARIVKRTTYDQGTALPKVTTISETDSHGKNMCLSSFRTDYDEDGNPIEEDDNGIKLRRLFNRYGSVVVEMDGEDAVTIMRYHATFESGTVSGTLQEGNVAGAGLIASVVEDATDEQLQDVCKQLGHWFYRVPSRIGRVGQMSYYVYDCKGRTVMTRQDDHLHLSLFNRTGVSLAEYVSGKGVTYSNYSQTGDRVLVARTFDETVMVSKSNVCVTNSSFSGKFVEERFWHDLLGNVIAQTKTDETFDGRLAQFEFERYPNGVLKSMIAPMGEMRVDVYDEKTGLMDRQVLVHGNEGQLLNQVVTYEKDGSPQMTLDPFGEKTVHGHDEYGRSNSHVTPDGVQTVQCFDGLGRVLSETSSKEGKVISHKEFSFGPYGKVEAEFVDQIREGQSTKIEIRRYWYDRSGRVVAERGVREKSWSYLLYDGLGRQIATQSAEGDFSFNVFEHGAVVLKGKIPKATIRRNSIKGELQSGQYIVYDGLGHPSIMIPLGSQWNLIESRRIIQKFTSDGLLARVEVPGLSVQKKFYNTRGQVVRELMTPASTKFDEKELRTDYEYSADGSLLKKTVGNEALGIFKDKTIETAVTARFVTAPQVLTYGYDGLGRSVSICQPDGLSVRRIYDSRSLPVEMIWTHVTEPTNVLRHLRLEYGILGRLEKIWDVQTERCLREYVYDTYGNVAQSVDRQERGSVTLNRTYDSLGVMCGEKISSGKYEFPIGFSADVVHGTATTDWTKCLMNGNVYAVGISNWRIQTTTFDRSGRLTSIALDRRSVPLVKWGYWGDLPVVRDVPGSCIRTVDLFDEKNDKIGSSFYDGSIRFGGLEYLYDEFGNMIYSSTILNQETVNEYKVAQYWANNAYRQLVAQNCESVILPPEKILRRHGDVMSNSSKSLQATKTMRMAFDLVDNIWAEYRGEQIHQLTPERLEKDHQPKIYSSAKILEASDRLTVAELSELASNRSVTRAAFSNDVLTAELNEYDKLGNMVGFDGEFWSESSGASVSWPVAWKLTFDSLGRLASMCGRLKHDCRGLTAGQLLAELDFLYDAGNRRICKHVVDHTGLPSLEKREWTLYSGNNQSLVFQEDEGRLRLREQYLWKGDSRELVTAVLPEGEAEKVDSVRMARYYFQQDRGYNTVCVTRADGVLRLVSGASYLGFGKNATMAHVVNLVTSMKNGDDPEAAYNEEIDDRRVASWNEGSETQFLEIEVSESADLTGLSIWTDETFPKEFRVYVLDSSFLELPEAAGDISHWEQKAGQKGCGVAYQKLGEDILPNRPVSVGLGRHGNRIVLVWEGRGIGPVRIREIDVSRMPNNPGSIAYAGQWLDRETGLYYQINRYKVAGSNKFISPDPIGFLDGNNLYAYAKNNPLEWHDPNGEWAHILLGALSGAVINGGVYALQCWITGEEFSWKEFGIQSATGAASGAIAAATMGAVNPWLQHAFKGAKYAAAIGNIGGSIAAGAAGGFVQGGLGSLSHGGDLVSSLSAGLKSAGWGALGGGIGGTIATKMGMNWGAAILGGSVGGGVVGGAQAGVAAYQNGGDMTTAIIRGIGKGAFYGGLVGAAAQGINKVNRFGISRPAPENGRPAFRSGVRRTVYENSKNSDGRVHDPGTGQYVGANFDMGHKPGYEYYKAIKFANDNMWTRETFNSDYNNPIHYRAESPTSNRSHVYELKTDVYFGTNF